MTDKDVLQSIVRLTEEVGKTNTNVMKIEGLVKSLSTSVHEGFEYSKQCDKEIISHQKETNGRVTKLENDSGLKIISWVFKSWQRAIVVIAVIVGTMGYAISWLSVNFGFKSIIEEAIKKIV